MMSLRALGACETRSEEEVCRELLPLDRARVLDLGCGKAEVTRKLARSYPDSTFIAQEPDAIQVAINLPDADLSNLQFRSGPAESIAAPDESFEAVLMLKSLHHVEAQHLDDAVVEIYRILVVGGLALFCEPVFEGEYNEVLRIFHDEQRVRELAFAALQRAVDSRRYKLKEERFFLREIRFESFNQFEKDVIGVTHTRHVLTDDQYRRVRERFMHHMTDGCARFLQPMRVDLLQKTA